MGRWRSGQSQQTVNLSSSGLRRFESCPAHSTRPSIISGLARGKPHKNIFINMLWLARVECPEQSRGTLTMYYVCMIRNSINRLYIGVTENLAKRLSYHNSKQGAAFTKGGNYTIVFYENYPSLTEARKREIQLKKWRRDKKEKLVERFKKGLPTKS